MYKMPLIVNHLNLELFLYQLCSKFILQVNGKKYFNLQFQIIYYNFFSFVINPSIAQLVERRTVVESDADILRSLVQLRLEGVFFFIFSNHPKSFVLKSRLNNFFMCLKAILLSLPICCHFSTSSSFALYGNHKWKQNNFFKRDKNWFIHSN